MFGSNFLTKKWLKWVFLTHCGMSHREGQGTAHMNIRETERGRMLGFFPAVVLLVWVRKGLRALAELSCRDAYERMKARDAQRWECATRCLRGNVLALTQLYRRSLKWSCSCYYSINQLVEHKLPNLLIFVVFDQTYSGQCLWVSTFYFILHIT